MDTDKNGSDILLAILLTLVLLFSYASIPGSHSGLSTHKLSKKAHTKSAHTKSDSIADHSDEEQQVHEKKKTPKVVSSKPVEESSKVELVPKPKVETVSTSKIYVNTKNIDIIIMDNPLYSTHKKGIVHFTHKKHIEAYAIGCGQCHHDDTGKPLTLAPGDDVQGCIECHKGTKKPKGEKLDKKTKIMTYHFEALHANCIACHKKFNIKKGDPKGKGPAPTSCTKCHPKK